MGVYRMDGNGELVRAYDLERPREGVFYVTENGIEKVIDIEIVGDVGYTKTEIVCPKEIFVEAFKKFCCEED